MHLHTRGQPNAVLLCPGMKLFVFVQYCTAVLHLHTRGQPSPVLLCPGMKLFVFVQYCTAVLYCICIHVANQVLYFCVPG